MLKWTLLLAFVVVLVPFQAKMLSLVLVGYVMYAMVWSTERAMRRRLRRALPMAAVGFWRGSGGAPIPGITTVTVTDDMDEDEDEDDEEIEEDWDDDWESEDEQ